MYPWIIYADSSDPHSDQSKPWWLDEKIKLKLCHIYRAKGMLENFVDAIFPLVRESLYCETLRQKVIDKFLRFGNLSPMLVLDWIETY